MEAAAAPNENINDQDLKEGKIYRMYYPDGPSYYGGKPHDGQNPEIVLIVTLDPLRTARVIANRKSYYDRSKPYIRVDNLYQRYASSSESEEANDYYSNYSSSSSEANSYSGRRPSKLKSVRFGPLGETNKEEKKLVDALNEAFNPPDLGEYISKYERKLNIGNVYYVSAETGLGDHMGIQKLIYLGSSKTIVFFIDLHGKKVFLRHFYIDGIYSVRSGQPHVLSEVMKPYRQVIPTLKYDLTFPNNEGRGRKLTKKVIKRHVKDLYYKTNENASRRRSHLLTITPKIPGSSAGAGGKVGGRRTMRRRKGVR